MSLWEKWEREKLEKQGIKVERHSDVEIYEMRSKVDIRKQVWIVLGTIVACCVAVYAALVLEALYNGRRWSETYIVYLFAEKEMQRQSISNNNP
ncbi:MAG: hypothetical protein LBQ42_03315 [Synergistaceae bacterium]|jgi:predicted outer membrane lipoprotein|nr:hypothetical protein [Synergistaceae bacterium]